MAQNLKISSQAVGNIRRKLEKRLIRSYSLDIDYSKLGIHTFAIAIAKLTKEGLDYGELEIEQILHENPHIINVYRIPKGSSTHLLIYGFKDLYQFENFFNSQKMRQQLHQYLETQEIFTLSQHSLIKNNPIPLFLKMLNKIEDPRNPYLFKEIENFKRRIG